jgi:hypothetical protein
MPAAEMAQATSLPEHNVALQVFGATAVHAPVLLVNICNADAVCIKSASLHIM